MLEFICSKDDAHPFREPVDPDMFEVKVTFFVFVILRFVLWICSQVSGIIESSLKSSLYFRFIVKVMSILGFCSFQVLNHCNY